jgi:predicted nucleic acid-binding protein
MEKELILCDTNILIAWLKGDEQTIEILQKIGLDNILIPSITFMELIQGTRNKSELLKLKRKIKNYNIIHFNDVASKLAVNLVEKYYLSHGLLIPDAIIAATAITFNFKLFTLNLKDFKFLPGIQLYNV